LLESRRYVYVLFMCQQSLEKLLKARVTAHTAQFPPRIHSLVRLAEVAALGLPQEDKMLLERLSLYYLQSRYPPEVQALVKRINRSVAVTHLAQTEALWKRLKRRLASKQ
jgi:HEPN domain-containing protein